MLIKRHQIPEFFSKDVTFWAYHFSMLSILVLVQLILVYILRGGDQLLMYNLFEIGIWSIIFSLAVLFYRYLYHQKQWHDLYIVKLIFFSIVLAIVMSHLVFFFFAITLFPFFWSDLYHFEISQYPDIGHLELLFRYYVGNIISTSLFMVVWMFLYIGITNRRAAKLSQLDNLRLQNSLKEAQLVGLSNQLNPHFLFNSLNNIRFMIHENAEQADNMITSFSEVLRYSLESSQHEKRGLRKEVEIIERYIEIVNIQFEDRLNFKMDIDENLLEMSVPPMLFQMLVENAVKHGLEQMQNGADIIVSAAPKADHVEFNVMNQTPNGGSKDTNSTGLGLKNIRQRLALLYANKASIDITRNKNTFNVKICLPN